MRLFSLAFAAMPIVAISHLRTASHSHSGKVEPHPPPEPEGTLPEHEDDGAFADKTSACAACSSLPPGLAPCILLAFVMQPTPFSQLLAFLHQTKTIGIGHVAMKVERNMTCVFLPLESTVTTLATKLTPTNPNVRCRVIEWRRSPLIEHDVKMSTDMK